MQVKAMADGSVVNIPNVNAIGRSNRSYDNEKLNKVEIQHGEYRVLYGNISSVSKYISESDHITKGQVIGETMTSEDFYIKMAKSGESVNPDKYIEEDLLNKFSYNTNRDTWENNVRSYSIYDFNKKYFKDFENLRVHSDLYDILDDIKNDKSNSWHSDEIVFIGNNNLYDSDIFDIKNISVNEEKNILASIAAYIKFDKDMNKGTYINKYFRELVDLLNMNGITSIIIHNEGIYFDIGPTQLINNKSDLDNPFDKLPGGFRKHNEQSKYKETKQGNNNYSDIHNKNKVKSLARVITGEARGEKLVGQIAVGAVVLNRLEDDRFPNTIDKVITQDRQFSSVANGQINIEPGEEQIKAARQALAGIDPTNGAIYFYNPDIATNTDFMRFMDTIDNKITIGNHVFAKN